MEKGLWSRAYEVKSLETLEMNRMRRDFAIPGFPYISYNGAEILGLGNALKVIHRDSVVAAIFENTKRTNYSQINGANKGLSSLRDKNYIKLVAEDQQQGFLYTLTDTAFDYLREEPFDVSWGRMELTSLYYLNKVFVEVVHKYRIDYTIEWVTEDGVGYCIIWEDKDKGMVLECGIYEVMRERFEDKQKEEIKGIAEKYAGKSAEGLGFPDEFSVYAVDVEREVKLHKVVNRGKVMV